MEQILETKKLILFEETVGEKKVVYRQHKEDENKELIKIYEKTGNNFSFEFDGTTIKKIKAEGFNNIPSVISDFGYGFQDNTINNFFRYQFDDSRINTIVISKDLDSKKRRKSLVFNLSEFEDLISSTNQEQRACNDSKRILIKNFLVEVYPEIAFDHKETNNNKQLIMRNLNQKLIDKLTADDIEKIGKFYIDAAKNSKEQIL